MMERLHRPGLKSNHYCDWLTALTLTNTHTHISDPSLNVNLMSIFASYFLSAGPVITFFTKSAQIRVLNNLQINTCNDINNCQTAFLFGPLNKNSVAAPSYLMLPSLLAFVSVKLKMSSRSFSLSLSPMERLWALMYWESEHESRVAVVQRPDVKRES